MKNLPCIILFSLFTLLSVNHIFGQKLIRINSYYLEDGSGVRQKISREEAQKLMYTFQDSKKYYKNYQDLMALSLTSAAGSLSFLGYYTFQKAKDILDFSSLNFNFGPGDEMDVEDKISDTPLYIGGGLLAITIITGIYSHSNFTKAIDTYNEKSGFQKAEKHSLKISVAPGSVGLVYSF